MRPALRVSSLSIMSVIVLRSSAYSLVVISMFSPPADHDSREMIRQPDCIIANRLLFVFFLFLFLLHRL